MAGPGEIKRGSDQAPDSAKALQPSRSSEPVPTWLAILVLALLLAVVLLSGFMFRGLLARDQRAYSRQEIEIKTWTARLEKNPNDPKTHLGLGYAYQSDGRYDKALDQYAIVLKTNPRDTAALYNRGSVYFKLGVDDRGEKAMQEVLSVEPTHRLAAKALGEYYARKGEFTSLVAAVKPAADAHPEIAELQYLLGMAFEKLQDDAAAANYYQLAIKYSPDMTAAREGLRRVKAGQ